MTICRYDNTVRLSVVTCELLSDLVVMIMMMVMMMMTVTNQLFFFAVAFAYFEETIVEHQKSIERREKIKINNKTAIKQY